MALPGAWPRHLWKGSGHVILVTDMRHVKDVPGAKAFAIVRSMKRPIPGVEQLAELSPEPGLFRTYLGLRNRGAWGPEAFRDTYVPQFLADLARNPAAAKALNGLYRMDREGQAAVLACFCPDERLCHRSIVAGLLQGVGCDVRFPSGADYSAYYQQYMDVRHRLAGR